jgi:predicted nucleic acid-binding protein
VRWAILDTSIYINHWEGGLHEEVLVAVRHTFVVRQSSVVLSELRRGARSRQARRLVEALYGMAKIQWTPTEADWWRAGLLIRSLGDANHWDQRKRQEFQNDALIALTGSRYGATIVTANREDFELLGKQLKVAVLVV